MTKISSRAGGGARVAFDAAGNATAAWTEDVGGGLSVVRAARYLTTSGSWGAATNISDHGFYGNVRIAVNDGGDAIAVWTIPYDWDGGGGGGFAARYTAANATWGAPTKLSDLPDSVEIAIDNFGNAIIAWTQGNVVGAARYEVPAGWSTRTIEHSPCLCPTTPPHVAMDAGGNALLVWASANPPNQPVKVVRYVAATRSWTSPVTVSVATPWHDWMWPKVAMDKRGNAMVMWIRDVGTTRTPQATRYDAASGTWSTPKDLSVSQKVRYSPPPVLGVDDEGNFIVQFGPSTIAIRSSPRPMRVSPIRGARSPTSPTSSPSGRGNRGRRWHREPSRAVAVETVGLQLKRAHPFEFRAAGSVLVECGGH